MPPTPSRSAGLAVATALALAPGQHRVEVVRPGYRTAEREVEIASQGVAELTIELQKP